MGDVCCGGWRFRMSCLPYAAPAWVAASSRVCAAGEAGVKLLEHLQGDCAPKQHPPCCLQAWQLKNNVGVLSTKASQLTGMDFPKGEGVVLRPGAYSLPLSFGTMWGFASFAFKIRVRSCLLGRLTDMRPLGGCGVPAAPACSSSPAPCTPAGHCLTTNSRLQAHAQSGASAHTTSVPPRTGWRDWG